MAFRFQKRVKIAPGVRINFSKSGVSTSLGGRGATVNLSSKGVRSTISIRGTGLSWTKQAGWSNEPSPRPADELGKLNTMLEKRAKTFNALSPRVNKLIASWNNAIGSFNGGRGPSEAKFKTLSKRFESAMTGLDKIDDTMADQTAALDAVVARLNGMKFGMFGGKLKGARKDLLRLVGEHRVMVQKMLNSVLRIRAEIGDEMEAHRQLI